MSTYGDVYSFGILMLEIFTGKRPTDEQYQGNFNMHESIKMVVPDQVIDIVDESLLYEDEEIEVTLENQCNTRHEQMECLIGVLQVGLLCSKENPRDRLTMEDVISKLVPIRDKYIKAKLHKIPKNDGFSHNMI